MVRHPARPRTAHPAVREIVDDANELIGSEVCPVLAPELIVGNETTVGAAGVVLSVAAAAGGEATTTLEAPAAGGGF
jgi:hypothetical protein